MGSKASHCSRDPVCPLSLPPPTGSSQCTLFGPRCISGHSPWASWGHARNSCSLCPPCSVPPAPLGWCLGTERQELGVTLGHWLLFSFLHLHRRSGFGGSHVVNWPCTVTVHSCALSCVPVTPEGAGPQGVPQLPVCFPACRGQPPSCGQGGWFVGSLEDLPVGRSVAASARRGALGLCPALEPAPCATEDHSFSLRGGASS